MPSRMVYLLANKSMLTASVVGLDVAHVPPRSGHHGARVCEHGRARYLGMVSESVVCDGRRCGCR